MRICFISEASSYHAQRWTAALAAAGFDVHLISSSDTRIDGVAVHAVPIYSRGVFSQIRNVFAVRSLVRSLNPDVVHLFGLFSVQSPGSMFAVGKRPDLVVSVWGSDIVNYDRSDTVLDRIVKRHLLARGRCILAASRYLADQTARYSPRGADIRVVPWGVDTSTFRPAGRPGDREDGRVTIGFAKRFLKIYGCDVLLEAFRQACDAVPETHLLLRMAGNGPLEQDLRATASRLGIADRVEWAGWLQSTGEVLAFYQSLDMFVMPSRQESYGLAAVEAGACGVPVVASRTGGIPEIIVDSQTGLLVEPGNPAALGTALASLAADASRRMAMGKAAREHVAGLFDWTQTLEAVTAVYRSLAGRAQAIWTDT